LVADDQTVVREGLVMLLGLSQGIDVVGAAADGDQAVALAHQHRPDVVLMDLRMPRTDGVAATRRILEELPRTRVIVLTTYADDESVFAALEAGARGYLTKDAPAAEIQRAIRTVHAGEALLDPVVAARLVDAIAQPPGEPAPERLTAREQEVLALMAEGLSGPQIADRLIVALPTVKTHQARLYEKLGVSERAAAVAEAMRRGLLE
jgi:DNA-binding NarL/FixJ family response regulator